MQLSLSVRIAEEFLSKEKASMSLGELASLANRCGYQALCMRASQLGIQSKKYTPAPYSGQESLLAAFDSYYLKQFK